MMKLKNISFKSQFYLAIIGIVSFSLLAGFSYNIVSSYSYKKASFIHESELQAGLIADNSVAPILFFDQDGLSSSLSKLSRYKNIVQVLVYTKDEELYASYSQTKKVQRLQDFDNNRWFLIDQIKDLCFFFFIKI